jgi:hypothetical protein
MQEFNEALLKFLAENTTAQAMFTPYLKVKQLMPGSIIVDCEFIGDNSVYRKDLGPMGAQFDAVVGQRVFDPNSAELRAIRDTMRHSDAWSFKAFTMEDLDTLIRTKLLNDRDGINVSNVCGNFFRDFPIHEVATKLVRGRYCDTPLPPGTHWPWVLDCGPSAGLVQIQVRWCLTALGRQCTGGVDAPIALLGPSTQGPFMLAGEVWRGCVADGAGRPR